MYERGLNLIEYLGLLAKQEKSIANVENIEQLVHLPIERYGEWDDIHSY
jgi:hypothetical protein